MSAPLTPEQMIEKLARVRNWCDHIQCTAARVATAERAGQVMRLLREVEAAISQTARACGTCAHWRRGGRGGVFPLSCAIRVGRWAADDYCNLHEAKTTARETETPTP